MHESRPVTIISEKLSLHAFRRNQALYGVVCQGGELKFSGVNCFGLTFKFPEKYIPEKMFVYFLFLAKLFVLM